MQIEPFLMERWQSTYETEVGYNLSESGILPIALKEIVDEEWLRERLAESPLGYGHTRGSSALRAAIAARYPYADAENVLVTTGTAEANFLVSWWLIEPGDEVIVMLPNYMQIPGLVRGFGGIVRVWPLDDRRGWAPDLDGLEAAVGRRTKAIVVCNPNNPTGAVLSDEAMSAVVAAADRVGAWIVADEVYRGAELSGGLTPTFWGRCDRVLVTGGLSKAYGLPGLRVGWIVAPRGAAQELWGRHDYTSIAPAHLSDLIAQVALSGEVSARLASRTRSILQTNLGHLARWVEQHDDALSWIAPNAGAIAMLRYHASINSTHLAERLRVEQDVLVVPGDHFGLDGYLRVGYGIDADRLLEGLRRLGIVLSALEPREHEGAHREVDGRPGRAGSVAR